MAPKRPPLEMTPHYTRGNDGDLRSPGQPDLRTRFGAGAGGASASASVGVNIEMPRPSPVTFPPRSFPPPGSTSFYRQSGAIAVAGPAVWVVPAAITMALPANAVGVVRFFNVFVNNMLATSNILFALRVNGGPHPGFDNITLFPRAAAFVGESFGGAGEVVVDLARGATVDVMVTVFDAGIYTVGASYAGWYYPEQLAQTYARTGGYGY